MCEPSASVSRRIVPIRCFQCGMFVNHFQERFDAALGEGRSAKDAFEALGVLRPCCRVVLNTSAEDLRLRRRLKEPPGFARVTREAASTKPYVLNTTGTTDEVDPATVMPPLPQPSTP